MKLLKRLDKNDFEAVWEIMEDSFPVDERRTRAGQEQLFEEPHYRMYGYREKGVLVAFLALWEFDDFTFGEHFAVNKNLRNGGLGAKLLQEMLDEGRDGVPLVFEVEPPESEIARRRIGFYERHGCVMNPYDYIQPALSAAGEAIPLRIMSRPGALAPQDFEHARDTLYKCVYKIV